MLPAVIQFDDVLMLDTVKAREHVWERTATTGRVTKGCINISILHSGSNRSNQRLDILVYRIPCVKCSGSPETDGCLHLVWVPVVRGRGLHLVDSLSDDCCKGPPAKQQEFKAGCRQNSAASTSTQSTSLALTSLPCLL